MKRMKSSLYFIFSTIFLVSCATTYSNYVEPQGKDLATLNIKNVGTWHLPTITFQQPNGCTGRTWLGAGSVLPNTEMSIKLKPDEVFSFQIGSAKQILKPHGTGFTTYVKSCGPGLARFTPEKNGKYELIVGLITEKDQCIYSFKQKTVDGVKNISSFVQSEVLRDPWATATSPLCKKFQ